jgi:tripartite-type tricarboxylate transporter receptor subunit TctC
VKPARIGTELARATILETYRYHQRDGDMPRLNSIRALVACFVLLVPATLLWAEDYPSKPIRILAGAAPGGLIDLFARTFAQRLQERSGQPVVVENNSVATGTIGADLVAKSPPDGYTLLLGHPANVTIWPMINPKLAHMATEQFKLAAGIDLIHVPYRGSTPAMTDLIAGQVSLIIDTVPFNLAQVRAGALRALAVASDTRAPVLPDVPTMAEAGVPGVQGGLWLALFAPANTPPAVIAYLNKEAREIFALADVRRGMEPQGLVLPKGSPDDLAAFLAVEDRRWREVVKHAKIELPR